MKRLLLIMISAFIVVGLNAQNKPFPSDIDKLDSLASHAHALGNYAQEQKLRVKILEEKGKSQKETDPSYISEMMMLADCYQQNHQVEQATTMIQKALQLYTEAGNGKDETYAQMLSALAHAQSKAGQYAEGLSNILQALSVYDRLLINDSHLMLTLSQAAELSYFNGKHTDAINYELRALNIIKAIYGEHSEEYINEAPYLLKYYEENGQHDKANRLGERLEKITEETEQGVVDLPDEILEFKTAKEANAHIHEVARCVRFYLDNTIDTERMNIAASSIMQWALATDTCYVVLENQVAEFVKEKQHLPYLVAYIAGCCKYAIETGQPTFSFDMYECAIVSLLNFYEINRDQAGRVEFLDNYIKTYDQNRQEFEKLLRETMPKE